MSMTKLLIKLIELYQSIPFKSHNRCKYYPSCSEYSIIALKRYGLIKGTILTIKRILKCNPLSKGGYDPVPEDNK